MANPTTNYGFVLPTSSDLVTDLPADFDVALQGVDTRLKALQPGTTEGDLAYSSATANTNTRLGIGTTGQVLTVAGGVPTWAAAAAAGSQTSIANGSLTGSSVTLSSIAGTYRDLKLVITNFRPSSDLKLMMRFNGASTNYKATPGTYTASTNFADTELFISTTADGGAASQALIVVDIPEYANTTAWKIMTYQSLVNNETTNANGAWEQNAGLYKSTSAISSITLLPQAGGTFTTGDYVLYGVK
jgi:hypothetical protein